MKYMFKTLAISLVSSFMLVAPVAAAKPSSSGGGGGTSAVLTGNDVSWPQCSKRLPSGQAFGVVGVNGGLANNTNQCFSQELAWANASRGGTNQPKAALYVNTANPGDVTPRVADWPTSNGDIVTAVRHVIFAHAAFDYIKDVFWTFVRKDQYLALRVLPPRVGRKMLVNFVPDIVGHGMPPALTIGSLDMKDKRYFRISNER